MKTSTVFTLPLIAILVHQFQVCSVVQAEENLSPLLKEVEHKKALFYNRKPDGKKEKVKVAYVHVPEDDKSPEVKRTRRQAGSYWRAPPYSYGQPPLNPTGPPPGAFSPGSPYVYGNPPERRLFRRKYKSKPKPVQSKTPCPYKLLAEELAAEQQRREHSHEDVSYRPKRRSLPSTTTTTTTTPRPTTTPQPVYSPPPVLPPPAITSSQIFYQPFDQMGSLSQQQQELIRLQQQNPFQYETIPHELLQTPISTFSNGNSLQHRFPLLVDNNNGLLLNRRQYQNPGISLPQQQQLIYSTDFNPTDITGRSASSQIILNQQPYQQSLFNDQLQSFGHIAGVPGNQILFDRQAQLSQHLAFSPQSVGYPHQQQQLLFIDNPQTIQQTSSPQTYILPSGQVVQVQQQHQLPQHQQQPLVLLNSPSEHQSELSFLKPSTALNRRAAIRLDHPDLPILSQSSPLGGLLRHRNRVKSPSGPLPIFLRRPEDEEEEDAPPPVVYHQPRKKPKRMQVQAGGRDGEKKRYILISKKELEQMKNKKLARQAGSQQEHLTFKKNLPPPPEVVHIPSYPTPADDEDDGEDAGDMDNDSGDDTYNFNNHLSLSSTHHKQQHKIDAEENVKQLAGEDLESESESINSEVNSEDTTE